MSPCRWCGAVEALTSALECADERSCDDRAASQETALQRGLEQAKSLRRAGMTGAQLEAELYAELGVWA